MRLRQVLTLAVLAAACGHSPSGPEPPPPPTTTLPVSRHDVAGVVFYDEDGNGQIDAGEDARVPGVVVRLSDRSGQSAAEGRFTVPGVADGSRTAQVEAASLPPFFAAGTLPSLTVPPPGGFELAVPVRPPIGQNRPHTYLAFGDSITQGDGSRHREGYRRRLESMLTDYWGRDARVIDDGVSATRSEDGAARIDDSLRRYHPAYTLVLYGTNDWNTFACHRVDTCATDRDIRSIIRSIKAAGSLPVIGTIPPVNPAYVDRFAYDRNGWVAGTNDELRPIIRAEGGVIAEVHGAMVAAGGDHLEDLFSDHVHPNDDGYEVIANAFFRAIVTPVPAAP